MWEAIDMSGMNIWDAVDVGGDRHVRHEHLGCG